MEIDIICIRWEFYEIRACESADLILLLDLKCFLAGEYPKAPSDSIKAVKYPLQLYTCNICGILQIGSLRTYTKFFMTTMSIVGNIPSLVQHFEKYVDYISDFYGGFSILRKQ